MTSFTSSAKGRPLCSHLAHVRLALLTGHQPNMLDMRQYTEQYTYKNQLTKLQLQLLSTTMRTIPQMNFLMAVQWTFIGVILLTYRIIVESQTIVSISAPPPPLENINISLVFENIFHVSSLLCPFYLLRPMKTLPPLPRSTYIQYVQYTLYTTQYM